MAWNLSSKGRGRYRFTSLTLSVNTDIVRSIASKRGVMAACWSWKVSTLADNSNKLRLALPKAPMVSSNSTTRLPTCKVSASSWRTFESRRTETANKLPTANTTNTSMAIIRVREWKTVRLWSSAMRSVTCFMSPLTSAATEAERVDTSAELNTTLVSSSSWRETSDDEASAPPSWAMPSAACSEAARISSSLRARGSGAGSKPSAVGSLFSFSSAM